jgi:hypothetical protein
MQVEDVTTNPDYDFEHARDPAACRVLSQLPGHTDGRHGGPIGAMRSERRKVPFAERHLELVQTLPAKQAVIAIENANSAHGLRRNPQARHVALGSRPAYPGLPVAGQLRSL